MTRPGRESRRDEALVQEPEAWLLKAIATRERNRDIFRVRMARREQAVFLADELYDALVHGRTTLEKWTKDVHPDDLACVIDAVHLLLVSGRVDVDRSQGAAYFSRADTRTPTQV